MEVMHPSEGGSAVVWNDLNAFFMRRGDAFVVVQHPITFNGLRQADPGRYGALASHDATQLWGMIADAGIFVKTRMGLPTRRLFLTGYSFTGVATATFASFHHAETRLRNGKPVFDGYVPMANAMYVPTLDVPVIRMLNQSDFNIFGGLDNRDEHRPRYRIYEVAGSSHIVAPRIAAGSAQPPRPISVPEDKSLPQFDPTVCTSHFPASSGPNTFPTRLASEAIFENLSKWVDHDIAPPPSALLDVDSAGQAVLDEHGNAKGGLRLPPVLVPAGHYGMGTASCFLFGYAEPFEPATLHRLYGSDTAYKTAFGKAVEACISERTLTRSGGDELLSWLKTGPVV
jgi:hypothetical protein